ncbi:unnamed protein product [Urochloa decumbens]|uniref:F-box domain-containing protein n=1 Tax=Urochloa decumbens TaxID=240449 RepID=A0ABC9A0Z4_9POAL
MASVAETSSIPPELAIGSRPLLVRFNDGEQKPGAMVMDPFDVELREARTELDMLRGKECRACLEGEWLLMSDEGTDECFLLSLASLCKIPLPPLPADDAQSLSQCALSSPTPADCTVVFSTNFDNYLLCCRPGDEGWRKLPVETDGTYRLAMGSIVSSRGRMYADTEMGTFIAVDASMPSSSGVAIERTGIPRPSTMRWPCKSSLVESDGEIFLLQFYIHGFWHSSEVVDVDIHLLDTSAYVWNKVESIGDRTIFVAGDNCVVLPSASRAGIQPGYIHVLHKLCRDGVRLYTIRLHDRTMSCTLLPGSYDNMYWVVPSSFIKKKNEESALTLFSSEVRPNIKINKPTFDEDVEQVAAPWSSLPVDMVDELVSRLSFIDYLSVRQVCKRWSSISKPAQYAKRYPTYPVLMSICSSSAGTFKLFDPITEKEYTLKNSSSVSCDDDFQMLFFAKHGWVLVLRGSSYMYATNPFTGEMLELPEIPWLRNQFDGISFSSAPKSPDCVVCAIDKTRNAAHNNLVMVWHAGDEHWTELEIDDNTQFCSSYSNPVFYHDEFYCLGTRGNLGVFNPHNMTWRVLDKPGAILDGDPKPGDQYCHLLEFRDNPMDLYRLDMSQMVRTKVERLDNEVVFVDNWNAVMVPAPRDTSCNRIYISKVGGYNEEGESNRSAFYDLKSRKYNPSYFNLTERMNSIWIEPNFKSQ